jgi:hypothetical protein
MGFELTTPRDVIGFYGTFWDSGLEYDDINLPPKIGAFGATQMNHGMKKGCSLWSNMSMNYHPC